MMGVRVPELSKLLARLPRIATVLNLACGALALAGWHYDVSAFRSPLPASSYITPTGALAFMACGLALWRFTGWTPRIARIVSPLAAAAVTVFCLLTILEYATGAGLGLHGRIMARQMQANWTLPGPPGRFALNTALAFTAFGVGALFPRARAFGQPIRELMAGLVLLLSLMTVIGYAYQVFGFAGLGRPVQMALYGALLFQSLGGALFFAVPEGGSARLVLGKDAAGLVSRRLLLGTLACITFVGWLLVQAERAGWLQGAAVIAALVVGAVVIVAAFTLSTARVLQRIERSREVALRALTQSEERMRVATRAAEMGVWVWEPGSGSLYWNEKTRELFGVAPEAPIDYKGFIGRLHPEERERVLGRGAAATEDSGEYNNQYRIVRGDGEIRWVAVRGRKFLDLDGTQQVFGVIWDVTDTRRTQDALVRGEKLASVGRMAATIAHEINNPLEAVMNLVYLCAAHEKTAPEIREYLGVAEQELRRVAHLVRQTLGFYRETAAPTEVDVSRVVDDLIGLYRRKIDNKQIRVVRRLRPDLTVYAVAGELRQVVSNLISNAIDAVPAGGTVTLRVAATRIAGSPGVRITVADTGCGIPREQTARIFEPFFTTKPDVGTGLGLWVSRQIVAKHAGTIRVRSKPDAGTVFAVTFPAQAAAAAKA